MKRIHYVLIMLWALYSVPSNAQVSVEIGLPHVNIGINLPVYPELVVVPGYPVYYAQDLDANYFFYDGVYWVYQDDNWYESSWYNGPWVLVDPEFVPVFVLRIPVFYYRRPPEYFFSWQSDEPPRWGEHWGHDWERHRRGWDKWDHGIHHKPAPLPNYQRQYSGERYPRQVEQQHELHQKNYRYQPHDPVVRKLHQGPIEQTRPTQPAPHAKSSMPQDIRQPVPHQQDSSSPPRTSSPQRGRDRESAPVPPQQESREIQIHRQQSGSDAAPHEQQIQQYQNREARQPDREFKQQNGDAERESPRGQERDRGRDR